MSELLAELSSEHDHRQQRAEQFELLVLRLELLEPPDRRELELYLQHGVSFRQLSALCGASERTMARRLKRLIGRLLGGEYITFVRNRQQFSPRQLDVAYDRYLLGLSYRAIAAKRCIGVGCVRGAVKRLERWKNSG